MEHLNIKANGINIHYVTEGKGPLVVLLHGFPEFWYAWRHQIPALAQHFKVVAPDLRGYHETERPPHVEDYRLDIVAKDISGLIRALGNDKATVVGHDWGGAVAWKLAYDEPEILERLAILNSPHPAQFKKALKSNLKQMLKSWYIFFFQIPWLPERLFLMRPKAYLKSILKGLHKETFSNEDIAQYLKPLLEPGAMTAALNYYRASFRKAPPSERKISKIATPTLMIWGEEDKALGKELTEGMEPLFSGPFQLRRLPQCSHWVQEEQPEEVNRLLMEFLFTKFT
ncbi:MAG: alpha/beta hydrolase [Parachlamydia sp.]|nr:alpha/beta hydrolase [Parachlamydia sp.]